MHTTVQTVAEESISAFVEFSKTHYVDSLALDYANVRWRHLDNPVGKSLAVHLEHDGSLVGRIWIQFSQWRVKGKIHRAASPIDFLIQTDFRNTQNFLKIFRSGMSIASENSDFIIHTSNPDTDKLYQGLLKKRPVTELDCAIFPVRPWSMARTKFRLSHSITFRLGDCLFGLGIRCATKLLSSTRVQLRPFTDFSNVREVIRRLHVEQEVCRDRSEVSFDWRFKGAGSVSYQIKRIVIKGQDCGYLVYADRDINDIKGRFVLDVVVPGSPTRRHLAAVWMKLASVSVSEDRECLFFFYNKDNKNLRRLASFPMMTVKRKFLPQRIPIFVQVSQKHGSTVPTDANWQSGYFVLADLDMF